MLSGSGIRIDRSANNNLGQVLSSGFPGGDMVGKAIRWRKLSIYILLRLRKVMLKNFSIYRVIFLRLT